MTWTLVREQARAGRTAMVWSAVLLVAATALATFAWTATTTEVALQNWVNRMYGWSGTTTASAVLPETVSEELEGSTLWGAPLSWDEVQAIVAEANSEGSDAIATVWEGFEISRGSLSVVDAGSAYVQTGAVVWEDMVAQGAAPGPGEVLLSPYVADGVNAQVGDTVVLSTSPGYLMGSNGGPDSAPTSEELVVSGIGFETSTLVDNGGFYEGVWLHEDDIDILVNDVVARAATSTFPPDPLTAWVNWSVPSPVLEQTFAGWVEHGSWRYSGPQAAPIPLILAAVLCVGLVVLTFTVGRALAQQRVTWVATARALGASRASVARATVVEGLALGFGALVGGVAVGYLAALAILPRSMPDGPVTVQFPASYLPYVALGAMILGMLIAVVPAIFASRVPPSAALKETARVDEAQLSRSVSIWPVVVLFVLSYGATVALILANPHDYVLPVFTAGAALLTGLALLIALSRKTARGLARWLQRSSRPQAVRAGLDLAGHPRQAATLSVLQFLTVGGITTAIVVSAWNVSTLMPPGDGSLAVPFSMLLPAPGVLALFLGLGQVLCAAVFASTRTLTAADADVTKALGLPPGRARLADFGRCALPQIAGVLAGGPVMFVLSGILIWAGLQNHPYTDDYQDVVMPVLGAAGALTLILMVAGIVVALAGSALQVAFPLRRR